MTHRPRRYSMQMGDSGPSVICVTDRLILRPVVPEDADFVFNTMSEPGVNRFIGGFRTLEWHRNRNREIMEHQRQHGFARWSVLLKSTGEQIGRCGPMFKEIEGVCEAELGYAFRRDHWGHGYATEAGRAALEYCFSVAGQRRVVAIIDPVNHASIRVAEKIGMNFDRMIDWEGEPANLYSIAADGR
jgi:RimJ/RimL family protein N-acetyltransferase